MNISPFLFLKTLSVILLAASARGSLVSIQVSNSMSHQYMTSRFLEGHRRDPINKEEDDFVAAELQCQCVPAAELPPNGDAGIAWLDS